MAKEANDGNGEQELKPIKLQFATRTRIYAIDPEPDMTPGEVMAICGGMILCMGAGQDRRRLQVVDTYFDRLPDGAKRHIGVVERPKLLVPGGR